MNLLVYNLFLWLYHCGIWIVSPWNSKARLWLKGRKDLIQKIRAIKSETTAGSIWMHCASLGEFEQGRPILEALRKKEPGKKMVISFFSPSGYEVKKDYPGADYVFYLPPDSKKNARIFVDAINPKLVIWVKYDYWYYYLQELKEKNIPNLLVSAIFLPDQAFFKWYGGLYRRMLANFTHIFVQHVDSKNLLSDIDLVDQVSVIGDTRFDRVIEIAGEFEPLPIAEDFCKNHPVIVAGSTWEEDEEELDHFANSRPDIRFIIAPHEVDQPHLKEIENLFQRSIRYSALENKTTHANDRSDKIMRNQRKGPLSAAADPNVLIVDNIGLLSRLYRYGTIAYVGGGFGDDGVHNVLEAAVYGRPVVYGPVIEKYVEALDLVECGGGIVIDSAIEAESVFNRLLSNQEEYALHCEASKNYVYSKRGATDLVIHYIQENRLLTNW